MQWQSPDDSSGDRDPVHRVGCVATVRDLHVSILVRGKGGRLKSILWGFVGVLQPVSVVVYWLGQDFVCGGIAVRLARVRRVWYYSSTVV